MLFVGIDISKLKFDVAVLTDGLYKNKCFSNDIKGFKSFLNWTKTFNKAAIFCMEATGIYGLNLAKYLSNNYERTIVVNPIKTHNFSKMEMNRTKTDKADAKCIARYVKYIEAKGELDKYLFKPKGESLEKLQYLNIRLEQLNSMFIQENNRLQVSFNKDISRSIKRVINRINTDIKTIKLTITSLIEKDNKLSKQVELLTSINGIGDRTAWAILAYIGDILLYSNAKQITSYAGLNPRVEQSGTSINRSRLSKLGNKRLRKALYMPALVAVRYNPLILDLYQRLIKKGKPKKLALCAAMRKLLVLSYGVLKSEQSFSVNYQA